MSRTAKRKIALPKDTPLTSVCLLPTSKSEIVYNWVFSPFPRFGNEVRQTIFQQICVIKFEKSFPFFESNSCMQRQVVPLSMYDRNSQYIRPAHFSCLLFQRDTNSFKK